MADTTTTNYSITKVEVGASEDTWGAKLNTNADTIDTQMKANADAAATADGKAVTAQSGADLSLKIASDLSDLTSASTARTNLGLGTAATTAATAYATAAQGTLADDALAASDAPTQTEATWVAGVSTTESRVSPAKVKAAIDDAATPYFESAQQSISASSKTTVAHGLGAEPKSVMMLLECVTAENGYSIGDKIITNGNTSTAGSSALGTVSFDSTNVYFSSTNQSGVFQAAPKGGGAPVDLTSASWRIVFRAWG